MKREGQLQRTAAICVTAGGRIHGAASKTEEGRGSLQGEEGSPINDHGCLLNNCWLQPDPSDNNFKHKRKQQCRSVRWFPSYSSQTYYLTTAVSKH